MRASSFTSRIKRCLMVTDWPWWQLPPLLRVYVAIPVIAGTGVIAVAAALTHWRVSNIVEFLLLVVCGTISVASTPKSTYAVGGLTRDFSTQWLVPGAM